MPLPLLATLISQYLKENLYIIENEHATTYIKWCSERVETELGIIRVCQKSVPCMCPSWHRNL